MDCQCWKNVFECFAFLSRIKLEHNIGNYINLQFIYSAAHTHAKKIMLPLWAIIANNKFYNFKL